MPVDINSLFQMKTFKEYESPEQILKDNYDDALKNLELLQSAIEEAETLLNLEDNLLQNLIALTLIKVMADSFKEAYEYMLEEMQKCNDSAETMEMFCVLIQKLTYHYRNLN